MTAQPTGTQQLVKPDATGHRSKAVKSPCARLPLLACAWVQSEVRPDTVAGLLAQEAFHLQMMAKTHLHRVLGAPKLMLQCCILQVMGVVSAGMLSKADATSMAAVSI